MKPIEFKEDGRTFTCNAAASRATPDTLWWWISITGESQRYAAFRVETGDTLPTLRPRVLRYYEQLLADRARPAEVRSQWKKRGPATSTAGDVGDAPDGAPPPLE